MRFWEYAGLTQEEGEKLGGVWLEELPDGGPIPLAMIDLAPGAKRPSANDVQELRRFGAYLRGRHNSRHSGDGSLEVEKPESGGGTGIRTPDTR